MRKTIKYSSPGLVLAAVALVVALGGTSVAGGGAQTSAKAIAKVNQVNQSITVPPQSSNVGVLEATVNCPNGTTVVGGGVTLPSGTPATATDMFVAESGPAGNGWHVRVDNDRNEARALTASATCLKNKLKVK